MSAADDPNPPQHTHVHTHLELGNRKELKKNTRALLDPVGPPLKCGGVSS